MKKIIGVVIASLVFANIAFAEMTFIEEKRIKIGKNSFSLDVRTLCIDGYKFAQFAKADYEETYRGTIQFYEERDGKALPAKC